MQKTDQRILIGVTGCIAAYKACEIVRCLQKKGCDVRVVMTASAAEFVGPQTFAALTQAPVGVEMFGDNANPIPHIEMADWCDLFLVVPCTANVAAKLACGIADDLLTSTALAVAAPVVIAPAMNVHMYENPATQANLETLRARGVHVIDAASGHLACGYEGKGKLPDPTDITEYALNVLRDSGSSGDLAGRKVVITSGPTVEPIDAVRFISNHSSGKMGAALAEAAIRAGAEVTVISGPVKVEYPEDANIVPVKTAEEMLDAAMDTSKNADIAICAAAVADYRPKDASLKKLKKATDRPSLETIELVENPDILKAIATSEDRPKVVVGFAAETDDLLENAKSKLKSKNVDMIVANEVGQDVAFGQDSEKAYLVTTEDITELPEMKKTDIAKCVIEHICI